MAEQENLSTTSLASQAWVQDPATVRVYEALDTGPGSVRFVGGCVRNALLRIPVADVDLATVHPPRAVVARLEAAGIKAVPTGIEHGTITAVADHKAFEITTLRKDVATDGRRATVAFTDDWTEDARRRDFTMNAIYLDRDGTLFDPVGGLADLRARKVRFIGAPEDRIREDYLRILRYFRFHTRYGEGEPDPDALKACAGLQDGIETLSGERVQTELLKLLESDRAMLGLRLMAAAGILTRILPRAGNLELAERLIVIESTQLFSSDPLLRLAALLEADETRIASASERLKLSNAARDRLLATARDDHRMVSYLSMREIRRYLYRMGIQLFQDKAMLAWAADPKPSNAVQWRALIAIAETWQAPEFPLTGEQVIAAGVPKGPDVGRVLREVEEWWIDSDFIDDELSVIERLKAVVQATVL